VILLPLNWRDESLGTTCTSTGGRESFGPPVGATILAQPPDSRDVITNDTKNRKIALLGFIMVAFNNVQT
jgi:hypothetical protein